MKEYKNIELKTNKLPLDGLGQWIVTISGDDWIKILNSAEKKLLTNLQIPGFRKGKVPPHIAKKHINDGQILKNAGNSAIKIAYQYGLDQKDLDVKVTNKPNVEITDLSKNSCQLTFNFDLDLEINLKDYKNFDVLKPEVEVKQEEIDEQIKLLKDRFAVYSPKETGTLAVGDIAIFDFKGKIDNQEFPGNQAKDTQLEIGSNQFIPGFEDQMVGMKAKETKVFKVTFPKEYHVENLADKEAEFTVDLKEIKIKIVNDNKEELIQDINMPNITNYQELLDYIKMQLTDQKLKSVKDEFLNNVFTEILKSAEIVVPNSLIDKETGRLINEFKSSLKQQNVSFEDYQKMTNLTEQDVKTEAQKDALWQLQTYIITEEIAKLEKITVLDSEIETYLQKISSQFNVSIEEVKKNVKDINFVISNIRRDKTLDWIWENNGVTDSTTLKSDTKNASATIEEAPKKVVKKTTKTTVSKKK